MGSENGIEAVPLMPRAHACLVSCLFSLQFDW